MNRNTSLFLHRNMDRVVGIFDQKPDWDKENGWYEHPTANFYKLYDPDGPRLDAEIAASLEAAKADAAAAAAHAADAIATRDAAIAERDAAVAGAIPTTDAAGDSGDIDKTARPTPSAPEPVVPGTAPATVTAPPVDITAGVSIPGTAIPEASTPPLVVPPVTAAVGQLAAEPFADLAAGECVELVVGPSRFNE